VAYLSYAHAWSSVGAFQVRIRRGWPLPPAIPPPPHDPGRANGWREHPMHIHCAQVSWCVNLRTPTSWRSVSARDG